MRENKNNNTSKIIIKGDSIVPAQGLGTDDLQSQAKIKAMEEALNKLSKEKQNLEV